MPFVTGFLRLRKRPGRPDIGLPEGEHPVDPDYGVDEGAHPDHELPEVDPPVIWPRPPIPEPPVGIWPPLTPEHPWRPLPGFPERPSTGPVPPGLPPTAGQPLPRPPGVPDQGLPGEPPTAGHLPALPPGTIWPPLPPGVQGKFLALVLIAGMPGVKYRYVVVDASLRPEHPMVPPPTAQPK